MHKMFGIIFFKVKKTKLIISLPPPFHKKIRNMKYFENKKNYSTFKKNTTRGYLNQVKINKHESNYLKKI